MPNVSLRLIKKYVVLEIYNNERYINRMQSKIEKKFIYYHILKLLVFLMSETWNISKLTF